MCEYKDTCSVYASSFQMNPDDKCMWDCGVGFIFAPAGILGMVPADCDDERSKKDEAKSKFRKL